MVKISALDFFQFKLSQCSCMLSVNCSRTLWKSLGNTEPHLFHQNLYFPERITIFPSAYCAMYRDHFSIEDRDGEGRWDGIKSSVHTVTSLHPPPVTKNYSRHLKTASTNFSVSSKFLFSSTYWMDSQNAPRLGLFLFFPQGWQGPLHSFSCLQSKELYFHPTFPYVFWL